MEHLRRTLGFDTSTAQGGPRLERVFVRMFRTPFPIVWTPIYYNNGLLAYGDRTDLIRSLMHRVARISSKSLFGELPPKSTAKHRKRSLKEPGFIADGEVVLYDARASEESWASEASGKRLGFTYVPGKSLKKVVERMAEFRAGIRSAYEHLPYGPVSRKAVLAFVKLTEDDCRELLLDGELLAGLEELMLHGHRERVYLFILAEDAAELPMRLLKASDFSGFVGDLNKAYAEEVYGVPVWSKTFGHRHVGVVWEKRKPQILREVVRFEKEEEDWVLEKKADLRRQDEEWSAYLELLESERS